MRLQIWKELSQAQRVEVLRRPALASDENVRAAVAAIIARVRRDGDQALIALGLELDRAKLTALEVTAAEFAAAEAMLTAEQKAVIRAAAAQGLTRAAREFAVFPGSGGVGRLIELPDQRLGGESIASVFRSAGAEIRQSWCGPCFGQGPDALSPGQRAITTFNRNWQNRMGIGGEGYLASPAVVAASALVGYMAPPSELGLKWSPEIFAV